MEQSIPLSPIEKARAKKRQMLDAGEPVYVESNLIKKYQAKPTLKRAVSAFCFHCMGGTENDLPDSGWRGAIGNCTSPICPLYNHRPYRSKEGRKEFVNDQDD